MKLLLFLLLLAAVCPAAAQLNKGFSIRDLQTPDAPGFVLADKAPASIQKPKDPVTFGVDLLSLRNGGAVQATPFWFFRQPRYDLDAYLKPTPLLSTLNLSVASFQQDNTSFLSAGIRTQVLRIFARKQEQKIRALEESSTALIAQYDLTQKDEVEAAKKSMDSLARLVERARSQSLLQVELAAAWLWGTASGSVDDLRSSRSGVWLNARLSPFRSGIELLLLTRYSRAEKTPEPGNAKAAALFDYGLAFTYNKRKVDGSLEWVNRYNDLERTHTHRLATVWNFQLIDEITLVASFGRNFRKVNNLIAIFGVKLGISKTTVRLR